MKTLKVLSVLLSTVLLACAAFAADQKEYYIGLKFGSFDPDTSTSPTVDKTSTNKGPAGELVLGGMPMKNLAWEIGIGTYGSETAENIKGVTKPRVHNNNGTVLFATAKGIWPASEMVDLFAGAGVGRYDVQLDGTEATPTGTAPIQYKKSGLGYHVVGGVDVNLSRSFALGVELKWFTIELLDTEWGGTTMDLALKYRF